MRAWFSRRVHHHDVAHFSKGVTTELTIKYDILNLATDTLTLNYKIRQLAGKTLTLNYKIRQLAGKTLTFVYDSFGLVTKTLTFLYENWGGTGYSPEQLKIPHPEDQPKHRVLNRYSIPITATMSGSLKHDFQTICRLKTITLGMIEASTDKFKKIEKITPVDIRLSHKLKEEIPISSGLKEVQTTGSIRAKLSFKPLIEFVELGIGILQGRYKFFTFNEIYEDIINDGDRPQFTAFTHSSSFVGNVRYDQFNNEMWVFLNGKHYHYCNVPERIFDAFKGAGSKGAYYNRIIKGQFNCG